MGIKPILHKEFFTRGVSIAPLVVFRILFGGLLLFGTIRFLLKGWVYDNYIATDFHFKYYGFDWVETLPGNWMYLPFALLCIASLGIVFGWFYRFNAILAFICFTYVELLDKTFYLNHYYFVSLILFLLIFVPANKAFSLDVKGKRVAEKSQIRFANIFIIQFQVAIVYIFAAFAKLETDWLLEAEPLRTWLNPFSDVPVIGGVLSADSTAYLFAWFGIIYDTTIVFFLINNKTRNYAYAAVVIFHVFTWLLFPIGIFPWVMIASATIFFSEEFHEKLLYRFFKWRKSATSVLSRRKKAHRLIGFGIILYVLIQITMPFRYALYPGNIFWNEEGFRFSWRVMVMHKVGNATFYVVDPKTKGEIEIVNEDYLSPRQIDQMSTQPDMILEYAHYLKSIYQDTTLLFGEHSINIENPEVHADVKVHLNGRNGLHFIDKKHNLADFKYDLRHREWLNEYID